MMGAGYRVDVTLHCTTCDVDGRVLNVGSLRVMQLLRAHKGHDVTVYVANYRIPGRAPYAGLAKVYP